MILTPAQLIEQFMLRKYHAEPGNSALSTTTPAKVTRAMVNDWYNWLLHNAPPEMLVGRSLENEDGFSVEIQAEGRRAVIKLPSNCVRVFAVDVSQPYASAQIAPPGSFEVMLASNSEFVMFGNKRPVAVCHGKNTIILYGENLNQQNISVTGVLRPLDGSYELTEAALSTIGFINPTEKTIKL